MISRYFRPKSMVEAISICQRYGGKAKYIAGGTDVVVKIKEKQIRPRYLISLKGIPEIGQIRYEEGELKIGALVTHRMLELSPIIQRNFPIIIDAVRNIGSVQIRNVATIGGNIVNAVPSADGAIPLIALGAKVRIVGPNGERTMPLEDIFVGPGQTLLGNEEILREILIPKLPPNTGAASESESRAVFPIAPKRVIVSAPNLKMTEALRKRGIEVIELDLSEFAKGGGGPTCLTLPLIRD